MRVLIDFSQIPVNKVGVGVYAFNLIKELNRTDKKNEYFIVIQNDDDCFHFIRNERFHFIKIKSRIFRIFPLRMIMEQAYLPFLVLKHKIDLVHSLHYSFPLLTFGAKKVVTVHDLTFFLFPDLHVFVKRYYFRWFTLLASKMSDRIICVSESTRNDLFRFTHANPEKTQTIHLGIDKEIPEFNLSEKEIVFARYQIEDSKRIILFIGTLEPRKNISNLIKAFGLFKKKIEGFQLVIVGGKGWYYHDLFELAKQTGTEDLLFTGYVSEREKQILLSAAEIFVYPSVYEGFGIPVLEAILYKVPTITSNLSSLPEVAGDAALLIDPASVEELLSAMIRLAENQNERNSLSDKCFAQLENFSWGKTALETISLYHSLF